MHSEKFVYNTSNVREVEDTKDKTRHSSNAATHRFLCQKHTFLVAAEVFPISQEKRRGSNEGLNLINNLCALSGESLHLVVRSVQYPCGTYFTLHAVLCGTTHSETEYNNKTGQDRCHDRGLAVEAITSL